MVISDLIFWIKVSLEKFWAWEMQSEDLMLEVSNFKMAWAQESGVKSSNKMPVFPLIIVSVTPPLL